jgi:hypothetical protein
MDIAQRGTSQASITAAGYYTVDRFQFQVSSMGTWTNSQSTDVPTGQGFASSFKVDCTTADASPSASDLVVVQQKIEGQNLQYLKKGTSSAESTTLSFWVKSSKTGTYIAELFDNDNSRQISKSYTINSANTWEKKTITYAGDTTGALDNDNTVGLTLNFWLGVGSDFSSGTLNTSWNSEVSANRVVGQVNLADNTANEWYITGVQLEAGTASDFEFLPTGVMESLCERYYSKTSTSMGGYVTGANQTLGFTVPFAHPTTMRATPSVTVAGSGSNYNGFNMRNRDEKSTSMNIKGAAAGRVWVEYTSVEFESEL